MPDKPTALIPVRDYYINEKGLWVFTADYLRRRGYCCESGCMHCPYGFKKKETNDFIRTTDQMGNELSIPFPPKRIISLVPSQTELLFDLGLDDEISGITKFCIHPADKIKSKEKIGGTKKFNIQKIHALRPDLIIGNKEENYQEGIQQLQQHYPVWMSDIVTLADAYSMIKEIGNITNRSNEAAMICDEILKRFNSLQSLQKAYRAAYFIWRDPFMVAARDTFIHEMLMKLGVENVFDHLSRYPEIELSMLAEQKPDLIFLSSEPYPFSEKHFAEFASAIPDAKIMIVDGRYFSWYGSRLLQVPGYLESLKRQF